MIRQIGPDDWVLWRDLWLTAAADAPAALPRSEVPDSEDHWRAVLSAQACFVGYEAEEAVGFLAGHDVGGDVELTAMWVAPAARRRGVGRQLIEAAVRWSAGRPLSLRIAPDDHVALHAFSVAGFVLDGGAEADGRQRMVWMLPPFRLVAAGSSVPWGGAARRVGLGGVLADLNRVAPRVPAPSEAAVDAMTWSRRDQNSRRWWPQGITTSADANAEGLYAGRSVVMTSWYARGRLRRWLGSRLSVIDGVDEARHGYRHVLLVDSAPWWRWTGRFKAVRVHAGGIVWFGDHVYVTGSSQGLRVFRLDDISRVRNRLWSRGYRYVLAQHRSYVAEHDADAGAMTYSFLSLDHGGSVPHLVAGQYGRKGGEHRLMRFALDPDTGLLQSDESGRAVPAQFYDRQVERMQGATIVGNSWIITASAGEGVPGDLWVGRPGKYTRHRGVLPTGPEDVSYWPQRRQVWTSTEWPGHRWVFGIDIDRWL